jgi:hypothetical protein
MIRIICRKMQKAEDEWDDVVQMALMAIRGTRNRALGMSPFEVITGTKMVMPHNAYQRRMLAEVRKEALSDSEDEPVEEDEENDDFNEAAMNEAIEHKKQQLADLSQITRPQAMENILKEQQRYKKQNDKKRKVEHYKVEDVVLVANMNRIAGRKGYRMQDNYSGPYRIVAVFESTVLLDGVSRPVNVDFLRRFNGPIPSSTSTTTSRAIPSKGQPATRSRQPMKRRKKDVAVVDESIDVNDITLNATEQLTDDPIDESRDNDEVIDANAITRNATEQLTDDLIDESRDNDEVIDANAITRNARDEPINGSFDESLDESLDEEDTEDEAVSAMVGSLSHTH